MSTSPSPPSRVLAALLPLLLLLLPFVTDGFVFPQPKLSNILLPLPRVPSTPMASISTSPSSSSSSASSSSPASRASASPTFFRRRWRPLFQQQTPAGEDPSGAFIPTDMPPIPPSSPSPLSPNYKTIAALIGGELLLGLLAFPLGHFFKINPLATAKAAMGFGPILAVSALLTLPALLLHFASGSEIEDMLRESLEGIFGSDTAKKQPLVVIAISVLLSLSAGIGEEVAFRGALQPILSQVTNNPWMGLGISSFIFAALHAATPRYFLLALLLSVYLGFLQLRYANLLVPIMVHTLFDVVGFVQNHFWGGGKGGSKAKTA